MAELARVSGAVWFANSWWPGEEPEKAFDDTNATNWLGTTLSTGSSLMVEIGVGKVATVDSYAIKSGSNSNRYPGTWTFDGSNDKINWTNLDTRTGETGWSNYETRTYNLSSVS